VNLPFVLKYKKVASYKIITYPIQGKSAKTKLLVTKMAQIDALFLTKTAKTPLPLGSLPCTSNRAEFLNLNLISLYNSPI